MPVVSGHFVILRRNVYYEMKNFLSVCRLLYLVIRQF